MADFDFDELDKAVTNALGGTSSQPDTPKPVSTPTPVESTQVPTPVVAEPVRPIVEESLVAPRGVPAARRGASGRFMDVVHPSSDMRKPSEVPAVKRTAATIQPPAQPSQPEPQQAEIADSLAGDDLQFENDWTTPLESPFLPDAKVEKRPLGGEAPTSAEFDPSELLEAPDDPRLEAHTMPDPIDFVQNSTVETVEDTPIETAPEAKPAVVEEKKPDAPLFEPVADSGYGAGSFQPAAELEEPIGPTSISQQYVEKPAETKQSGAIYDTESYHRPLAHVPKKKSGAWIILWIVLLIALGGGAGAAVYFYVLPML